jgi:hypothetical protein
MVLEVLTNESVKEIPENRLEELVRQKREGKSYSEIRAMLREEGMDEKEIGQVIRRVDERVLQKEISAGTMSRGKRLYITGVVIAAAGLLLTFLNSRGYWLTTLPRLVVYLPFFTGIILMFYGRRLQKVES